jgi:thiol:disulfide interchange protein
MLIIQIALGIVLAVVILVFWRQILVGGIALLLFGVVAVAFVALVYFAWKNAPAPSSIVGAIPFEALLLGVIVIVPVIAWGYVIAERTGLIAKWKARRRVTLEPYNKAKELSAERAQGAERSILDRGRE